MFAAEVLQQCRERDRERAGRRKPYGKQSLQETERTHGTFFTSWMHGRSHGRRETPRTSPSIVVRTIIDRPASLTSVRPSSPGQGLSPSLYAKAHGSLAVALILFSSDSWPRYHCPRCPQNAVRCSSCGADPPLHPLSQTEQSQSCEQAPGKPGLPPREEDALVALQRFCGLD